MSDKKINAADGVLIGRNYWDSPVRIELRAYLHFGRRMDSQLRRLVARWLHTASPAARGIASNFEQGELFRTRVPRSPSSEEDSTLGRPGNGHPNPR
ncbi:MAG: hypothetical protein ABFC63_06045 [Thermoguttaceae bacterium]